MSTYTNKKRMRYADLTQERLHELLRYNRRTGLFIWKDATSCTKKGAVAGYTNKLGYVLIGIGGASFYAHRLAWLYVHGRFPENLDHRDGNPSNNALKNLREATTRQNGANRKRSCHSTQPYKGIVQVERRWCAYIKCQGRKTYIGSAKTAEAAARMYDAEARKHFGKFARLNLPRRGEVAA